MKTYHLNTGCRSFSQDIANLCYGLKRNRVRAVLSGRGVVFLPDTDCSKDCEEKELIKALGLRDKAIPSASRTSRSERGEEESSIYIFSYNNNPSFEVELTPSQKNLLDFLWDESILDTDNWSIHTAPNRIERIVL